MSDASNVEKFSIGELEMLRSELVHAGIDSWQAADVVSAFLVGRGYGVNAMTMRERVTRIDAFGSSPEAMQAVLETMAYVM